MRARCRGRLGRFGLVVVGGHACGSIASNGAAANTVHADRRSVRVIALPACDPRAYLGRPRGSVVVCDAFSDCTCLRTPLVGALFVIFSVALRLRSPSPLRLRSPSRVLRLVL
jgi:hypothetical protein